LDPKIFDWSDNQTGGKPMSDDNIKTLCAHVDDELQVNDPKAYIKLISPASRYCEGCGRSAANAENLCKPKKIK
jgi:hypothetical protein